MSQIDDIISALAVRYDVPAAHIHAVVDTESGGQAFTTVQDRFGSPVRFPLMRFEGHHFHKYLTGEKLKRAIAAGLARPKPGQVKNPTSQQARYDMWMRARDIDAEAATAACSWGAGQVLGSHWRQFGMASPQVIYDKAASGLAGQLDLMMIFCKAYGLMDELRDGRWSAFAEGYNGPQYRKNRYDEKLAAAAARHGAKALSPDGMLRMGAKGGRVRELQRLLVRAGASLKADGSFGRSTKTAVIAFQQSAEVEADGVVGPETFSMLHAFHTGERENLQVAKFLEAPGVSKATGPAGAAILIASAKSQIEAAADQAANLMGIPYLEHVGPALLTVAGIIGAGAAAWAVYAWLRSGKTYEGVSIPSNAGGVV